MRRHRRKVVIERDESGHWIASVPSLRGCHSYGRTLERARARIREALGLWVEQPDTVELVEEIRLPGTALGKIRQSRIARRRAERGRERATESTLAAARILVEEIDLSVRDAATLLGISHQRVQQLVGRRQSS